MSDKSLIKPGVSFEFFPPRTDGGEEKLWARLDSLAALKPAFMTMTYGAGGSTRHKTIDMAIEIVRRTSLPTAAHLTFICTPITELKEIADRLWENNVRHIIALRGDLPKDQPISGPRAGYFTYTSDFVEALKSWHDFEISVGAYPEKHPDAPSLAADIEALRKKCDAGADRAITQFFFDNDIYFRFIDEVRAAGIQTDVVPGLLPVMDYTKMLRFAASCRASIPTWLADAFSACDGCDVEWGKRSQDILERQVQGLAQNGVAHMHFYTLNHDALVLAACQSIGITGKELRATG